MLARFSDRAAAGRALAYAVADAIDGEATVLGVPNNGMAVAAPIARALRAPLGAVWIAKLALPREPGVVVGAVDVDGDVTLNPLAVSAEGGNAESITMLAYRAHQKLRARAKQPLPDLRGRTAIIVDDGLTTGITLSCALRWTRRHGAARVVVAVPVVDARIWAKVSEDADQAVTLEMRADGPIARSEVYELFDRLEDREVERLLGGRRSRRVAGVQNARAR